MSHYNEPMSGSYVMDSVASTPYYDAGGMHDGGKAKRARRGDGGREMTRVHHKQVHQSVSLTTTGLKSGGVTLRVVGTEPLASIMRRKIDEIMEELDIELELQQQRELHKAILPMPVSLERGNPLSRMSLAELRSFIPWMIKHEQRDKSIRQIGWGIESQVNSSSSNDYNGKACDLILVL